MRQGFIIAIFLLFLTTSCTSRQESLPITSLRFTPLNFPYSDLGEFTLHEAANNEQLQLFLKVFENTFSVGNVRDEVSLQDLANTFSLQLFSETKLTAIYRLSFDFEKDIAFLQNEHHIYEINKPDFHQIIETGYFNVMFRKNHAPTAEFLLNGKDIKYSVNGIWNYETYQNNFLSYQINKEQAQSTNYIVTDTNFQLSCYFPEKQPDEIYEVIRSQENIIESKTPLIGNQLSIPTVEGNYIYEIEAVWSNPELPYNAKLNYQFRVEVNYPAKVALPSRITAGEVASISVENYDRSGKIVAVSELWQNEVPLTLINQKYYGLLPIPLGTPAGEYEVILIGSNSTEALRYKGNLTVTSPQKSVRTITKKQTEKYRAEAARDAYYHSLLAGIHSSSEEKLWSGNFILPTAASTLADYGQTFRHKDFEYRYFRIPYSANGNFDIFSSANGIVHAVYHTPESGYCLLIDHGLGLFSLYDGMSEIFVTTGSYIFARQKIGSSDRTDLLPNPAFTYATTVHGYFVNPTIFFDRDPISLFK